MRGRKPSITSRMAALLDTMAFTCEAAIALADPVKPTGQRLSERESVEPSFRRYADEARALVAEYRSGGRRGS